MHELSIVSALIDLVEENAKKAKAKKINKVIVKIGRLSGIEIKLFKRCFDTFKQGSIANDAKLIINKSLIKARCTCGFKALIKKNIFICPRCEAPLELLGGDELDLMRLEME